MIEISKGKEKSPKISLLQKYRNVLVPGLESKVVKRLSECG